MTFWAVVLYAAIILVAILLIALILVQQSKGGGFGGAFGGLGESILGAQAGSHLTRLTVILSSIFFVLVLAVAVLVSRGGASSNSDAGVDKLLEQQSLQSVQQAAPAVIEAKTESKTTEKK
jgi:preprotein translocase subunit SecG